ncbi:thiamine pyrophosphate-binding protein [Mycolicibacter kumamotonensis]|uniref:Thiamine pyrophosphate enzyme N-terminal TPP-binding domain-containing protein n=1 Tax=Mycolicibacter kumamotonensis TaxID=354243 RepID=A0A7K3LFJ0_9MYCO|nr:hypothetical protein [Mycolicibacter kumamotonensis]
MSRSDDRPAFTGASPPEAGRFGATASRTPPASDAPAPARDVAPNTPGSSGSSGYASRGGSVRGVGVRKTHQPPACFGIAGPGSTNPLTGLYDAKVDSAPVLALSGSVDSAGAGKGAFSGHRPGRGFRRRHGLFEPGARHLRSFRVDDAGTQVRDPARVTDPADLNTVVAEALSSPGTALVEIITDSDSH